MYTHAVVSTTSVVTLVVYTYPTSRECPKSSTEGRWQGGSGSRFKLSDEVSRWNSSKLWCVWGACACVRARIKNNSPSLAYTAVIFFTNLSLISYLPSLSPSSPSLSLARLSSTFLLIPFHLLSLLLSLHSLPPLPPSFSLSSHSPW